MTVLKNKPGSPPTFFASKVFLALVGVCLAALSIFLWKTQEAANLAQLRAQTAANAVALSSEVEIRYRAIFNALNRLANRGQPDGLQNKELWEKDAAFFIESFPGLESIAWVDKNFVIRLMAPSAAGQGNLGLKANELSLSPGEVNLWVSVYTGNELAGFVLGNLDLEVFIAPLFSEMEENYALQLSNEGKIVFTAKNWSTRQAADEVKQTISLQNTAVLNLAFAPTQEHLRSEVGHAQKTLLISLVFSILLLSALHFAQEYRSLSRLNETRYRELLEQVQLVAVTLDLRGRVTFCNDYLLTLTGWKREEILGADWFERFAISNAAQVKEIILGQLLRGDLPTQAENPICTRSGEQRWVLFNNTILRNTHNEIIGLASLGEDVTERKRVKEALAESEKKLRALFETMSEGIVYENHDGKIISANPAAERLLGLSLDQMQGRTSIDPRWKAIHADGSPFPGETHSLNVAAKTGKPATGEVMGIYNPQSDAYVWLSVNSTPEFLPGEKKPFRAYAVFRDITARKLAEDEVRKLNVELEQRVIQRTAQLESANQELEAFSYSVSHDLRSPLRGIDGWSLALLEDYGSQLDEQAKTYLDRVRSETQRMGHLIDDLLQLSRLTRADMSINKVNLSAIAQRVAAHWQEVGPERQVDFVIQPGLSAQGDAHLVEIALTNLLDNAFKFTAKTPSARVEFGCLPHPSLSSPPGRGAGGEGAVFFVRDNGAGFDMALSKKLFGAFQRLHKTSDFPGTGVGLTTVQRIIHRHGGRIWAEAAVNQGATFYFTLEERL